MKKLALVGSVISFLMIQTAMADPTTAILINNSFKKLPITLEYDLCDVSTYPNVCTTHTVTIPAPTANETASIEIPLDNSYMYVYVHKMSETDNRGKVIAQSQSKICELYQENDAVVFNEYGTSHIFCNNSSSQAINN